MSSLTYNLTDLHRRLDDEIRTEMRAATPSSLRLLRLQQLRLRVKQRLQTLLRIA